MRSKKQNKKTWVSKTPTELNRWPQCTEWEIAMVCDVYLSLPVRNDIGQAKEEQPLSLIHGQIKNVSRRVIWVWYFNAVRDMGAVNIPVSSLIVPWTWSGQFMRNQTSQDPVTSGLHLKQNLGGSQNLEGQGAWSVAKTSGKAFTSNRSFCYHASASLSWYTLKPIAKT